MSINKQEFTNAGRDMLGRANAGENLIISRLVVGAGRATASSELWPLTALLDHRLNVPLTQKRDQGDGVLLCEGGFNSSQAAAAFELCEVGVMARIGTEDDRLYSVANVLATGADHVDPAVESIHAFKIKVVIDQAANVTVTIGDSTDILAENIGSDMVGRGWFESKIANRLRFKRAVAGTGIELIEDPLEPFAVTIAQRVLRLDLNLYVPETHPSAPSSDVAFPTIQAALDHLNDITIPPNRIASIHVQEGSYGGNINVTHPQSNRIRILGESSTHTILSMASLTGVSGNYAVTLNLDSAANITTSHLANIISAGGPNQAAILKGVFQISAVSGNTVTLLCVFPLALGPFEITGILKIVKTVIILTAGQTGIAIRGSGLMLLSNVGFTSNGDAANGITVNAGTTVILNNVAVVSCINGLYNAGYVSAVNFPAARATYGIFGATGSNTIISDGAVSYCSSGIFMSQSQASLIDVWSVGNLDTAWNVGPRGLISAAGYNLVFWNNFGLRVKWDSSIIVTGVEDIINATQNTNDVNLETLSAIDKATEAHLYWQTANQPAGFSTASGCYLTPSDLVQEAPEHLPERS